MGVASGYIIIRRPLYSGVSTRIDFQFFSDAAKKKPKNIGSGAAVVRVKDASGTVKDYAGTVTNATVGTGYITTTGASHTTLGDAKIWLRLDGVPYERYQIEVVEAD